MEERTDSLRIVVKVGTSSLTHDTVRLNLHNMDRLARTLGRDFVDRVVSRKLAEKYQKVIREKTTVFLALAFLLPYFPDDMLCILAGLTPITFGRFALLALFTRPWGLLFASALGGASLSIPLWAMVLIGLAGVMIFVLGMLYGDRLERAVLKRLGKE